MLNGQDAHVPPIGSIDRYLILEIAFIREVVKLTKDQDSRLKNLTSQKLLDSQPKSNRAINKLFQKADDPNVPDALRDRRITRAFDKAVQEILTPSN